MLLKELNGVYYMFALDQVQAMQFPVSNMHMIKHLKSEVFAPVGSWIQLIDTNLSSYPASSCTIKPGIVPVRLSSGIS